MAQNDLREASFRDVIQEKKDAFQEGVLTWAASHLRDYPWRRQGREPFTILVAELLLKRTTAAAAARLYKPFLDKYPTPRHLAWATEQELTEDLAPVGLYTQRSKSIAKLASYLMEHEGGSVPASLGRLLKIPGLGDYGARAVLSFGYDISAAVVDANVARVLQRAFQRSMPARPTQALLQAIADAVLPDQAHRDFNFGLLDLGALVCRYVNPKCAECPLNTVCDFHTSGAAAKQPAPPSTRLRDVRLAKGMSLARLAEKAGVSKLTIVNLEAGRTTPRVETLQRLADALGVSPEELTPSGSTGSRW